MDITEARCLATWLDDEAYSIMGPSGDYTKEPVVVYGIVAARLRRLEAALALSDLLRGVDAEMGDHIQEAIKALRS